MSMHNSFEDIAYIIQRGHCKDVVTRVINPLSHFRYNIYRKKEEHQRH